MNFSIAGDDVKLISALLDLWKQQGNLSDIEYDLLLDKIKNLYVQVKFGRDVAATGTRTTDAVSVDLGRDVFDNNAAKPAGKLIADTALAAEANPQHRESVRKKVLSLYDDDAPTTTVIDNAITDVAAADNSCTADAEVQPVGHTEPVHAETEMKTEFTKQPEESFGKPEEFVTTDFESKDTVADVPTETVASEFTESAVSSTVACAPAEEDVTATSDTKIAASVFEMAAPTAGTLATQVLGEVLAGRTTTIADSVQAVGLASNPYASVVSLRDSIGFNDKYMFVRELFGGQETLYDQTISILDNFTSIEDALIYIYDNFGWTRDNEAACRLFDLLDAKLK